MIQHGAGVRPSASDAAPEDDEHDDHDHAAGLEPAEAARILVVAVTAAAVWFRVWEPVPAVSLLRRTRSNGA